MMLRPHLLFLDLQIGLAVSVVNPPHMVDEPLHLKHGQKLKLPRPDPIL